MVETSLHKTLSSSQNKVLLITSSLEKVSVIYITAISIESTFPNQGTHLTLLIGQLVLVLVEIDQKKGWKLHGPHKLKGF